MKVADILFVCCFTHVFSWIFNLLLAIETHKHKCDGLGKYNGFNLCATSLAVIFFLIWAIKEWRRERNKEMRRDPYMRPPSDEDDGMLDGIDEEHI